MNTRFHRSLLAVVAIPLALGVATPASASIFDSIGKAAKSVGKAAGNVVKGASKTVSHAAKDVGHAAGNVAKSVGHTAEHAAKDVGHAAGSVAKSIGHTAEHAAKDVGHAAGNVAKSVGHAAQDVGRTASKTATQVGNTYMNVARPVGKAVSQYYSTGAKVIENVPGLKEFAPLARDAARAATSNSGKIGAAVGAGLAVATGGISTIGLGAGQGGMTGYYAEQGYKKGKKAVNDAKTSVRREYNDIRRSFN